MERCREAVLDRLGQALDAGVHVRDLPAVIHSILWGVQRLHQSLELLDAGGHLEDAPLDSSKAAGLRSRCMVAVGPGASRTSPLEILEAHKLSVGRPFSQLDNSREIKFIN